ELIAYSDNVERNDDGGVKPQGEVSARARWREPLDHVEAGQHRGGVEGTGDLARSAADAFDHLSFEDLPALGETVLGGARTDHGVEGEELVREQHHAVEPRRAHVDVARARRLIARAREVGLIAGED